MTTKQRAALDALIGEWAMENDVSDDAMGEALRDIANDFHFEGTEPWSAYTDD